MSITLASSAIQTLSVGGVQIEDDTQGAVQDMFLQFNGPNLTFTVAKGNVSGATLVEGTNTRVSVTFNATTGFWQTSNGLSGIYPPAQLPAVLEMFAGWRNDLEQFVVNNNIMVGTYVPWP